MLRNSVIYCKHISVYCTRPPVVSHASHNAHREQTTYPLEISLTYQCKPGYVTSGFPKAKCLSIDGRASWFGPDIICERKFKFQTKKVTSECLDSRTEEPP